MDKLIGQEVLDQFAKENPEPADIEPASEFSRYYSLHDLTYSLHGQNPIVPCTRYGATFSPEEIRGNLTMLCARVLDPIADIYGKQPLTSVYRGPLINNHPQVQGAKDSAHLVGLAADTQPPRAAEVLAFLAKNWEMFRLDRVIFEERIGRENKKRWLHLQVLPKDAKVGKPLWIDSPVAGVYEKSRVEVLMTRILQSSVKANV